MPPKRRARGSEALTASDEPREGGKPKKRRVSLACDACRAAREKCDGARPECGTCVSQKRACSYTPTTKKRGVQTGYLRTIELSLAWIFDRMPECEESLHRLLAGSDPETARDSRALLGKGSAGHRLQKVWHQNRVRKAIDGLLSDTQIANSDNSGDDSDTDVERRTSSQAVTTFRPGESVPVPGIAPDRERSDERVLQLPANWKRLLDVYLVYTHCWLPIVDLDALHLLASTYPPEGIRINAIADDSTCLSHSELWAAMAIASYQDVNSTDSVDATSSVASQICGISRTLIPPDDGVHDIHSINAMIIQAVILIGREKFVAASLVLGKSARLLRQLGSPAGSLSRHPADFSFIQHEVVSMACSFLDILTSLFLGQHPMREFNDINCAQGTPLTEFTAFDQPWDPLRQQSRTTNDSTRPPQIAQPMRTLAQLRAFSSVLGDYLVSQLAGEARLDIPKPEDLVRKLDDRFNFCNSLISSGSTPMIPSAYLVKLLFLAATIELTADLRSSLLSGFLEIIDSCFDIFGADHTPPVVMLLIQLVQKRAKVGEMGESDRSKWCAVTNKLQNIWSARNQSPYTLYASHAETGKGAQTHDVQQVIFTPMSTESHPHVEDGIHARSQSSFGLDALPGNKPAEQFRFGYQDTFPNAAFDIGTPLTTHPSTVGVGSVGRANTHPMLFPGNHRMSQNFDYDAIFEDLGSIGYTDNLEMNTRFMTNLGFAPGCNLAEIFQEDFGV